MDQMLTIPEVCRVLGIGKSTFYRWKAIGHGPPTVPIGPPAVLNNKRLVRVRLADLQEWLRRQS